MDRIASTRELRAELQRILKHAEEPNPSRVQLAEELRTLANKLALKPTWHEKGTGSISRVQYADGVTDEWMVQPEGDKFTLQVRTPTGVHKSKKMYESAEKAQKFAERFIQHANGHEHLEEALKKGF